ncbi:MAG: diphthamide biosynthesis protein, partial [Amphiamblys sp. WSBS2006]
MCEAQREMFEIEALRVQIGERDAVAVQLAGMFMDHAECCVKLLEKEFPTTSFYLIQETKCAPCCLDIVTARIVGADALLHYGPRCHAPQRHSLAVYSFPGKMPLPDDALREAVRRGKEACLLETRNKKILVEVSPEYSHRSETIKTEIRTAFRIDAEDEDPPSDELFSVDLLVLFGRKSSYSSFLTTRNSFAAALHIDPSEGSFFYSTETATRRYAQRSALVERAKKG